MTEKFDSIELSFMLVGHIPQTGLFKKVSTVSTLTEIASLMERSTQSPKHPAARIQWNKKRSRINSFCPIPIIISYRNFRVISDQHKNILIHLKYYLT